MITLEGKEYRVEEYLADTARRIRDIDAARDRISDIEARMSGLRGMRYRDDPASPNVSRDAMLESMAQLEEAHARLDEEVALNLAEIERAWELCRPHASLNRHVLWLHHVQGMSWGKVARAMHVSERTVFRMRDVGVAELYRAMSEQWREDFGHRALD